MEKRVLSRWSTTTDDVLRSGSPVSAVDSDVEANARSARMFPAIDLVRVVVDSPLRHPDRTDLPIADDVIGLLGTLDQFRPLYEERDLINVESMWLSADRRTLLVPDCQQYWCTSFVLVSVHEGNKLHMTISRSRGSLMALPGEHSFPRHLIHGPSSLDPVYRATVRPLTRVDRVRVLSSSVSAALPLHEAANDGAEVISTDRIVELVRAVDEWERELSHLWERAVDLNLVIWCIGGPIFLLVATAEYRLAVASAAVGSVPVLGRRLTGRREWTALAWLGLIALIFTNGSPFATGSTGAVVWVILMMHACNFASPIQHFLFLVGCMATRGHRSPDALARNGDDAERAARDILRRAAVTRP